MKAKEKAQELVDTYSNLIYGCYFAQLIIPDKKENVKQCALIAVDEIIEAIDNVDKSSAYRQEDERFWQEVKKEIEAL